MHPAFSKKRIAHSQALSISLLNSYSDGFGGFKASVS